MVLGAGTLSNLGNTPRPRWGMLRGEAPLQRSKQEAGAMGSEQVVMRTNQKLERSVPVFPKGSGSGTSIESGPKRVASPALSASPPGKKTKSTQGAFVSGLGITWPSSDWGLRPGDKGPNGPSTKGNDAGGGSEERAKAGKMSSTDGEESVSSTRSLAFWSYRDGKVTNGKMAWPTEECVYIVSYTKQGEPKILERVPWSRMHSSGRGEGGKPTLYDIPPLGGWTTPDRGNKEQLHPDDESAYHSDQSSAPLELLAKYDVKRWIRDGRKTSNEKDQCDTQPGETQSIDTDDDSPIRALAKPKLERSKRIHVRAGRQPDFSSDDGGVSDSADSTPGGEPRAKRVCGNIRNESREHQSNKSGAICLITDDEEELDVQTSTKRGRGGSPVREQKHAAVAQLIKHWVDATHEEKS